MVKRKEKNMFGWNETIQKMQQEECDHEWGFDGAHQNEYCKKCFVDKPKYPEFVDRKEMLNFLRKKG